MRTTFAVLFVGVLLNVHALRAQEVTRGDRILGYSIGSERLLFPEPPNWQIVTSETDKTSIYREMIPAGQTPEDWRDMIIVSVAPVRPELKLKEFLERLMTSFIQSCALTPRFDPPVESVVFGSDTAVQLMACPRKRDWNLAEVIMMKSIRGARGIYQVNVVWRRPAVEKANDIDVGPPEVDAAVAFLNNAFVCDDTVAGRQCPALQQAPK